MNEAAFNLNGKVALITGASSGIGQRQAKALAASGATIIALGRRQQQLDDTLHEITAAGGSGSTLAADLTDRSAIPLVYQQALALHGQIDILINAAGVNLRQNVDEITPETWDQTLNLNLSVPFFLARECVADMKKRAWGRILNIASLQSTRAFPNGMAYGASKGGIVQLTRAMAEAWSGFGVNCNAIAPGFFPTELTAPVFGNAAATQKLAAQTAIGRNGELADLDGVTVFLCADASEYITGQTLNIDGGFTAK